MRGWPWALVRCRLEQFQADVRHQRAQRLPLQHGNRRWLDLDQAITDVEYTGDLFPHLAPARLAYIAAINSYRPPGLDGRFTWCELGCGQGSVGARLARMLCVVKHRGSAMSDEIAEYRIGPTGLELGY